MPFQYTVTLNDPTNALTAAEAAGVMANYRAALETFSRHITGQGTLDAVINVNLADGASSSARALTGVFQGTLASGQNLWMPGTISELRTGVDPNGSTYDLEMNLSLYRLRNNYWIDPSPTTRSDPVPANKTDLLSIMMHEISHALGFNGWGDLSTGVVTGNAVSTYDQLVETQNGYPVFVGAEAVAAYGGPVPLSTHTAVNANLTTNDYHHYGRTQADGFDLALNQGGYYAPAGTRLYIDAIDLAFFRDMGINAVAAPIPEASGSRFNGYGGNDLMAGGVGPDTLIGGTGNDTLNGAEGNDSLTGGDGADSLDGGAGRDTEYGGADNDTVSGGDGMDFLRGEDGNDVIYGGADFDDTHGNAGDDTVYGGQGDDWVVGGKDNDVLYGDEGSDVILGNLGNDTCYGGDGSRDVVRGGQGDDVVYGGDGDDYVSGDRGNDTVYGGAGADVFHGSQDQGVDMIMDFSIAEGDRVMLDPGTTYTLRQQGADVIIDTGGGNQMVIANIQLSALPNGWIFSSYIF